MRTARVAAHVLAAGLVGATSICLAPPSSARETWTTTTVAKPSAADVVFGETIDISVDVDSSGGLSPSGGTSTLMARRFGATEWTAVASSTSPGPSFLDVAPRMLTQYKVVYSGWTDTTDGSKGDTYKASESLPFTVQVARRITHPESGFDLAGRVTPRYGKRLVVIRISSEEHSGYSSWRTILTDRRGRYSITLPKRSGTWYWKVSVKRDDRYLGNHYVWETWVS